MLEQEEVLYVCLIKEYQDLPCFFLCPKIPKTNYICGQRKIVFKFLFYVIRKRSSSQFQDPDQISS